MRLRLAAALCLIALLAAAPAVALEPYLVKDINPLSINPDSNPRAWDPATGRELWALDPQE